ncbi:GNAT family N-acetyltransferase [Priestia filamentosa]|uniref:GNAT family N-acetyltransferase n=1 Tax=Priestia filamentosa TaxID=1402861 RepID=UPI001FB33327|nr:N-acetyltransferase [Priestia filamentosa]MED3728327.1 N-acetyltransferase [Priestia filamentosa]UOE58655.1 GNAT family N-acetyltransferase [Priestia filamentosa]
MLKIRNAALSDLPRLIEIEKLCFSKEEAATPEATKQRLQYIRDSFFVAEEDGIILGLVNGPVTGKKFITDDLFEDITANPSFGGHQTILGLAVHPDFQSRGISAKLLAHLEKEARKRTRETITLTCKEDLISFYEKHGYINMGVSDSAHGGAVWYNMSKRLK